MGESNLLRPEPMERALHTAAVFASFCRAAGVEDVIPVATSAVRDAANRDELLQAIRNETGLDPRVLDGKEEARYGFLAIANSTTSPTASGSTWEAEACRSWSSRAASSWRAKSLRLGAVRVSEAFLPGEKASPKQIKALRAHVAEALAPLDGGAATARGWAASAGRSETSRPRSRSGPATRTSTSGAFSSTAVALEELIEELAARPRPSVAACGASSPTAAT